MNKDRVRRGAWGLAVLCFVIGFLWVLVVNQQGLLGAFMAGALCAIIPLFVVAWLLFSPSPKGPLSYMGRRPPTLPNTDGDGKGHVKAKPKGTTRL